MKLRVIDKNAFVILIISAFILNIYRSVLAQTDKIDGPIAKAAYSTFHAHEEPHIEKAFHKPYPIRKRMRKSTVE